MEARTLVTDLVTECHMRDLSLLNLNGKDLIPDDVRLKNAANRLLTGYHTFRQRFPRQNGPVFRGDA